MELEEIGKEVVDSAVRVHRTLGPGLLETAYQRCLCHELRKRGCVAEEEVSLPIRYGDIYIDAGYRLDILVERSVIIENKVVEKMLPIHQAQLLTYLKLSSLHLGYLINWNVLLIKDGVRRMVHDYPDMKR